MINKYKQKGAETVEFAMIALLFFAVLFAIIEFSRALFVWNALTEATRRGARMAVICPVGSSIPKQVAMFGDKGGSLATSPIINGLTPAMVTVSYSDVSASPTFVQVSITGYPHTLMIPLWGSSITAPAFTTTLPTESLGAVPTYPGDPISSSKCDF
ncbi:MAG: TadE/TadG family type IV pilus assembly protein [Methylobacter sp.]|nr:TadE/TadG family type IV pilus assembly protein [Methylobacter sp.]MDP2429717.1 TadE/TadG family type IV pilus assembly protein [Methylobacter sp.]MDP3054361.1 TadE/TadG family type IV pilus assembly protein [Methylobacter sp.]MDP3360991.1 TadE/TadG family type IV pilus assembly protein [Methylobacter sp.]MDZ4220966.1 TadE/TadG family type IV pilus assembly protein [Methylobacter sp.]